MVDHTFTMSEERARAIHRVIDSEIQAYKNHIASRVEAGDFEKAKKYVSEMRDLQEIFAAFNMDAKHDIARCSSKPLETNHVVKRSMFR